MAVLRRVHPKTKALVGYQVLVDTYDVDNVRKRITVGTYRTRKEAVARERDAINQRDRGTFIVPSEVTTAQQLESWLSSKRSEVSDNSLKDYEIIIRKHIIPALGAVPIQKLTATRLQAQYDSWRDAGMSARIIRGCHMRLSQALSQAVRFGIVSTNPCDSVNPPRLSRTKADTRNQQEATLFLHTAMNRPVLNRGGDTGKRRPDDLHPLWHLLLLEGMRRGEALGLRWRDVDLDTGMASIVQTVAPDKNNNGGAIILRQATTAASARSVHLTAATIAVLRVHRDRQRFQQQVASDTWQEHDLIVCTSKGTPVNPNNVSRSFAAIVKAAGLRKIRVHDLRHTSATLLLLAGVPAKVVSERLGHASIGVTLDIYSHVLPTMQADAALAMDRLMQGPAS